MDQIYIVVLITIALLAVVDLVVGVSNDAVNFLNSAIGSKAFPFKTIMIVASCGVAAGALFSSGMMEIARSGIFVPSMFSFNEVMIIFAAVMITDVLLLDVFNSLGLPTSTTVSIIFELLGAAVCMGLYQIYTTHGDFSTIGNYINTQKASEIVYSIFLSVLLAFSIGSLVQYLSRLLFTFNFESKLKTYGTLFGGIALTAITFFILVKGAKGASFIDKETVLWINENQWNILAFNFLFFTALSFILQTVFKVHILKAIILVGTFALALSFAGNDLVNFIGVPIAAWQSFGFYTASEGFTSQTFMMNVLESEAIKAPFVFLALAGVVMVMTLWFSRKARSVIETGVNLSRQGDGVEKFSPNTLSRTIVRFSVYLGQGINYFLPKSIQIKIDQKFEKPDVKGRKRKDEPAFDMLRASVNLIVASILISIGTSLKLPLSTTYVTFMVAMGSSFADRAWDRESAVYRVAGVINVIGGWFVTAIVAFTASFIIAYILKVGWFISLIGLLIVVGILLYNNAKRHARKAKEEEDRLRLKREDIITISEMLNESSDQISRVLNNSNQIYSDVIQNLGLQDLNKLKDNRKQLKKLEKDVDDLKGNVFYFIKNLDDTSVEASKFYIMTLGYLQDIVQSLSFITQNSYNHINNNHKQLKFNQIRDLKSIDMQLTELFYNLELLFRERKFQQIDLSLVKKKQLSDTISDLVLKQISRIRTTETSPKNSKLYFGLLLETNDLLKASMGLLELFKEFNLHAKSPRSIV